ncbi:MAG: hypothetical protein KC800_33565, partial [Candidatus Eremiobacteraeota bacterium]|nr:hypothetical protein [Candidatus Eremiobacteraeota bacterium]
MKLKIILFILLFTLPALAQSIEPDKLREAFRRGNYDALLSLLQEAEGGNLTEFTPVFGEFLRGELESEEMSFSDVSLMSEFTADIALRMIQASPQEQGAREMEKEFLSVLAQAPERSPLGSLYTCEALRELEHQESAARRTEVLDGLLDLFPVATVSYNVTLFGLEKEDTPEAREDLVEELKRDGFSPRLMTVLRRMETERSERLAYASRSLESSDDRGRYVISEELLKESSLSPELISYFRERAHLEKNRELALLAILNLVKHDEKNPPSEELLALLRSGQLGGNSLKKAGEVLRELPEEK